MVLETLLLTQGGTILSFAIFMGEYVIQAAKDKKVANAKLDDDLIRDYLEWLRRKDHHEIINSINTRHDELRREVMSLNLDLAKLPSLIDTLLQDEFKDIQNSVTALNEAVRPRGLSSIPLNYRDIDVPVIPRENDIHAIADFDGDFILSGQPGSGKTFLLYQYSDRLDALFIITDDFQKVKAELDYSCPNIVIIDDAIVSIHMIQALMQYRLANGKDFKIAAICWPFEKMQLMGVMGISKRAVHDISLISADEMADYIDNYFKSKGRQADNILIKKIRRQAAGRPGLAIRLMQLLLDNGIEELFEGRPFYEIIDQLSSRIEGEQIEVVLAAFAVGGKAGMSSADVSKNLGLNVVSISKILKNLATGGIIQQINEDYLAVIPASFRHILLKKEFFTGDAHKLDDIYWQLYQAAHDKQAALSTLIMAKSKGAMVDGDRIVVEIEQIENSSTDTVKLWKNLAGISKELCQVAFAKKPHLVIQLVEVGLHYIPDITISMLLNEAIGDKRPEHQFPHAPVRILGDWIAERCDTKEESLRRRMALLEETIKWADNGGDVDVVWKVLPKCMSLESNWSESDPGSGRTISMLRSLVPLDWAGEIAKLWDSIIVQVSKHLPKDWGNLLNRLHQWLFPHAPHAIKEEGYREYTNAKAQEVIQELFAISGDYRNPLGRWAVNKVDFAIEGIDEEFLVIFPPDRFGSKNSYQEQLEENRDKALTLGEKWAQCSPADVIEKIVLFTKQMECFDGEIQGRELNVFQAISQNISDLDLWIESIIAARLSDKCLRPFMTKAIVARHGKINLWLKQCLRIDCYHWIAIELILTNESLASALFDDISDLLPKYIDRIRVVIYSGDMPNYCLKMLCNHKDEVLCFQVALSDFRSDEKYILNNHRDLWLEMFKKGFREHDMNDDELLYDIDELLTTVPELAFFIALELAKSPSGCFIHSEEPYLKLFSVLDKKQKIEVLKHLHPHKSHSFVSLLVGDDLDIYNDLLSNEELKRWHCTPLKGRPSSSKWQEKATLAFQYEIPIREIALAAVGHSWSYEGSEVAFWQKWKNEFDGLYKSENEDLRNVAISGLEFVNDRINHSKSREGHESVYGFDEDE